MNRFKMVFFLGLSIFFKQLAMAQTIAFPGAEGFGKYATGGRNGQVVAVTNLKDDGEGSFRYALEQFPGKPLTIVFNISGIIELQSKINIKRSNLTIAGQNCSRQWHLFKKPFVGIEWRFWKR